MGLSRPGYKRSSLLLRSYLPSWDSHIGFVVRLYHFETASPSTDDPLINIVPRSLLAFPFRKTPPCLVLRSPTVNLCENENGLQDLPTSGWRRALSYMHHKCPMCLQYYEVHLDTVCLHSRSWTFVLLFTLLLILALTIYIMSVPSATFSWPVTSRRPVLGPLCCQLVGHP